MNRTPPIDVRRKLREELGFGCPVPGCGSPFLEWHHFDPPWHLENHHNPEGMIALCHEHHIQADYGAFTSEQLHAFKKGSKKEYQQVKAKFNWLRNTLLAVVGGNFYYEVPIIFQVRENRSIWFEKDKENNLLLNFAMPTASGEDRAVMVNNEFFGTGEESDIDCPPSAKRMNITYKNGDNLAFEFREIVDEEVFRQRYTHVKAIPGHIKFPITSVEITLKVAGTEISFNAKETALGGIRFSGIFVSHGQVGIQI